jgi:hypothetical protein
MAASAMSQQDRIMLITPEESLEWTRRSRKRRPHGGEPLLDYLMRMQTWRLRPWAEPTLIDRCGGAVATFALRKLNDGRLTAMGLKARIVAGGRCCCTDVVAHVSGGTHPSLLAFQEAARKGCVRCWYITQGIAKFVDRMVGAVPSETRVHLSSRPVQREAGGSVCHVRLRWPDTRVQQPWQQPTRWLKLALEFYHYEGTPTEVTRPIRAFQLTLQVATISSRPRLLEKSSPRGPMPPGVSQR